MRRLIPGTIVAVALSAGLAASASAAEVRATGYGALLPSGTQAGATATPSSPERSGSAGGIRPAGGGEIGSLEARVRVADGGVEGSADGSVRATGITLFDGRVTIGAVRMSARVEAGAGGPRITVGEMAVEGLVVNGRAVEAGAGSRVPVDGIGTLVFFERSDTATGVRLNGVRVEITDPAARDLIREPFVLAHLDLDAAPGSPPATTAPPPTAPAPDRPPARPRTRPAPAATSPRATPPRAAPRPAPAPRRPTTRPNPITVPEADPLVPLPREEAPEVALAPGDGYVFPVFGAVSYTDDYMAPRAGTGRHYGNDLFADTGTPLVAVADGVLHKVGVNTLGGNRLWLADDRGNWFYYAHMSAYAPATVEGARVSRGQVIGFVGNSGQAITTPPHLHFEIRPGGIAAEAINPYPHLLAWQRGADRVPRAFREGGVPAEPDRAVGAVIVDSVPERDRPATPGDGIAVPVG